MKKSALKEILFTTITLLIIFALSEIGFRMHSNLVMIHDIEMHKYAKKLKQRSAIPGLSHEHIPNVNARLMGVDISLNNLGFRGEQLPEEKEPNEKRIMVLGSSVTLGWGVPFESTFTTVLENMLNQNKEDDSHVRVVNAGIGNYNTTLQLILLHRFIDKVDPDLIVLHYFINDVEIISPKSFNFFVNHSYLTAYLYIRSKQIIHAKHNQYSTVGDFYKSLYNDASPGWNAAQNAILEIQNICKDRGIDFLVVLQPDLHDLSLESGQAQCHEQLKAFLTEHNLAFIDLMPAYREKYGDDPRSIWVNRDDSHPNSEGHQLIAEELFAHLKDK